MKLENIKAALKARANSLNLQVPAMPIVIDAIVVPDKPVVAKPANSVVANPPAVKANTPPKNFAGKIKSSPQIPLIMTAAQIQPADIGSKDKTVATLLTPPVSAAIPPTEEGSKAPAEKAARKPAARKAKENPVLVVSAPAVPLNDIEAVVAKYQKRAYVDAVLTATHASKVFTQDIEDIVNLQLVKSDGRDAISG